MTEATTPRPDAGVPDIAPTVHTFDTPDSIRVTVDVGVGHVRIVAGDRGDTEVEVRPGDGARRSDGIAARQTRVEYARGRLTVTAPRGWKRYTPWGGADSIDLRIAVPTGSQVRADLGMGTVRTLGRLGECRLRSGMGELQVDVTGPASLSTGMGDITADRVSGRAEITTGSGSVQLGTLDGAAVVRNSDGDIRIGEATDDLQVRAANGRIAVDRARAGVAARTANGDVRLGQVSQGVILAQTACGSVEVGIGDGVAAWLDLNTRFGTVHNALEATGPPQPDAATVEVRARTAFGDITVRRAPRHAGDGS